MKRDYVEAKPYNIKKIYPYFFWKHCEVCDKEFKKEYGWEITIPWSNSRTLTHHACCSCLDSAAVNVYAEKLMVHPPRPQPPLAPPRSSKPDKPIGRVDEQVFKSPFHNW